MNASLDLQNEFPVRLITISRKMCKKNAGFCVTFRSDPSSSGCALTAAESVVRCWGTVSLPGENEFLSVKIQYVDGLVGEVEIPFNSETRYRRFLISQVVYGYRMNFEASLFDIGDPLDSNAKVISVSNKTKSPKVAV